jgi:hypothetical protein
MKARVFLHSWLMEVGLCVQQVLEITDTKVRVLRMAEEFLQEDDTVKGWYNSLDQQQVIWYWFFNFTVVV